MTDREKLIAELQESDTYTLAETIADLEDGIREIRNELDPERLESALRMYVAELDYDIHKMIECPEDGRPDQYPNETQFFLRCWETAGESS